MCDECEEFTTGVNTTSHYNFTVVHRLNKNKSHFHCLSGPAIIYYDNNQITTRKWYINGSYVLVSSQEEFENSKEYREWKLKAFK